MKASMFGLNMAAFAAAASGTAANAATVFTTTGAIPYSTASFDFSDPPSWAPKDRNGSIYVTGLGTGVSSDPGNSYRQDVRFQGSGSYSVINGTGTYYVARDGQDPKINLRGSNGDYEFYIEFDRVRNRIDVDTSVYSNVLSEQGAPGDRNIDADDFTGIVISVKKISTNQLYSVYSSEDTTDYGPGYSFNLTSNSAVIAPVITPPVTPAVPEPATWAMMLVGFGLVGAAARYRRHGARVSLA